MRAKSQTRQVVLRQRDAIPSQERAVRSRKIADLVAAEVWTQLAPGASIALYAPKGSEVDTIELETSAIAAGFTVCYPLVVRGTKVLRFGKSSARDLTPGAFGLLEPPSRVEPVDLMSIAAYVVPAIAFDRRGYRIGWGRGYYDATLSLTSRALKVGIGFDSQLVERVANSSFDVPLHLIITESVVIRAAE